MKKYWHALMWFNVVIATFDLAALCVWPSTGWLFAAVYSTGCAWFCHWTAGQYSD